MSDIEVIFGTNAPQVTAEIDRAAVSTEHAEMASLLLGKAVRVLEQSLVKEAAGFKKAAAAAAEYAKQLRASQNLFTGAPNQIGASARQRDLQNEAAMMVKRRQVLTSIAKKTMEDLDRINGGGPGGGGGGGGGHRGGFRQALGSIVGRFVPGADRIGVAAANGIGGGALAGIAAITATAAAIAVVAASVKIADFAIERNRERVRAAAEAYLQLAHNAAAAAQSTYATGRSASGDQGGNIVKLVGQGGAAGLALANKYASFGTEGQQAAIIAQNRFGQNAGDALAIAARSARAGGLGIVEGVQQLGANDLKDQNKAADRLYRVGNNLSNARPGIEAAEKNIASNKLASSVQSNANVEGQVFLARQNNIPQAQGAIRSELAAVISPLTAIQVEQSRTAREQLDVLQKINASQGIIASYYDRLRHGKDSAAGQYQQALDLSSQVPK